jgi:hypothetical protein
VHSALLRVQYIEFALRYSKIIFILAVIQYYQKKTRRSSYRPMVLALLDAELDKRHTFLTQCRASIFIRECVHRGDILQ